MTVHKLDDFDDYCAIRKCVNSVSKYSTFRQQTGVLIAIYDGPRKPPYYKVFIHKDDMSFYFNKFIRFLNDKLSEG